MKAPAPSPFIGRGKELDALAAALDAGRHVLVEGPQGIGKSRLVSEMCARTGAVPVVTHCSSALSAAALVGTHDPSAVLHGGYEPAAFAPGPLVDAMRAGRLLYLDEANRSPADAINMLISAMSEAELVIPRYGRVAAAAGFRVVAAVNPLDGIGSAALPSAFADRVVHLRLGYQSAGEERRIVLAHRPGADQALAARAVYAVRASRRHPDVRVGASIRGALDLVAIAAHLRRLDTRQADLEAALLALSSKITLRPGAERTVESVIRELWADAVISEHRAAAGRRADGAAGDALPPSSVELERTGEADEPTGDAADRAASATEHRDPASAGPAAAPGRGAGTAGAGPPGADGDAVTAETQQAVASFVRSSQRRSPDGRRRAKAVMMRDLSDLERLAAGIVVNRVRGQLPATDRAGGRFATVRYNFRSDDLDLDRTIGELVDTPPLTIGQLWVRDRVPRRRGVLLMLDVSGSMRGGRAIESATAAAAAALAAEQDELAVVAFGSGAQVLKRGADTVPVPELARRVLGLRPHGLTDLSAGLEAGLALLATMQSPVKIAVVMTDGVQNQGGDARLAAARYRQLNVLASTQSPWRLRHCQALAAAGRGRCLGYEGLDGLPSVISILLSG